MNKLISKLGLITMVSASLLMTACIPDRQKADEGKIHIVAASFAEYDWVRSIVGEKSDVFHIQLLIDGGTDLHSFNPTVQDIADIANADLLIHTGGVSDAWVSDVQKQIGSSSMKTISLMQSLRDKGAQVMGSSCSHGRDHGHSHGHVCNQHCNHGHAHTQNHTCGEHCTHEHHAPHAAPSGLVEGDEHIWLSLRHAVILTERIEDEISSLDPTHAAIYEANKKHYIESLRKLDSQYQELIAAAPRDMIIICDRFPFRYLLRDYDIQHVAAFDGCSAESEASFDTVAMLVAKLKELTPPIIFTVQGGMKDIASTVIANSGITAVEVEKLHAMQAVNDVENTSYIGIMEENLKKLLKGLSN